MDKGWTQLPLFVIFLLFLSNAHGFRGGAHSNAHHRWGQPSDKTFSPHAVQSSVSEVPVTGILPEEVGSSLFTNRPLKRLNLLQFVKGRVSSRHESTSQGSSVLTSEGSGQSISPQGESSYSGLSQGASSQYTPDSYNVLSSSSVSSQSTNIQSLPSVSTRTQSRSGTQLTSSNIFPVRGGSSTSSLYLKPQGTLGLYAPAKHVSFPVSSHPAVYSQSKSSSGALFGGSTGFASKGMSSTYSGSVQPQGTTSQFASGTLSSYPFVSLSSPQGASSESATVQSSQKPFTSSYGTQSESSKPFTLQGSTTYGGSLQPQDTTSQFASGSSSSYPSVSLFSPQHPASESATVQSSRKQFTSSYGTQSGFSKPFPLQGSTIYGGSLQPQDTTSQFASGSSSSYPSVSLFSPQHPASESATVQSSRKQFTSSYGTQSGFSKPFPLQGSTIHGGSLQPQGTTSQFASGTLSSYPFVSLSSPQGASSESATVQSSQKPFTSSYGTQSESSKPFTLQGSTTYGGSLQPQDTTSQFASGSSSSYPSVSLFSPQHPASESATVQSSRKQFTSSYGTQSGFSKPFPLQGSTIYGGSLQPQDTTSQFASGPLSFYPSVSLSSPQGTSSQSATVQSSRKQFTSTITGNSGTQSGFSKPFPLQGSTTYGGSLQPQDTTSQFASGSSSSYPSVLLSSPQGVSGQSATVQSSRKQFTSSYGTQSESSKPFTLQGSTTYGGSLQPQGTTSQFASGSSSSYPSVSLFSLQHPASESATVQSSRKQFTSSFGTQSGFSKPFPLQGSTTYGGSLQPQGTTSQFASGSLSSYPGVLLSSPQGASSQSATVQSLKQFTSTVTGNSGTQEGSSAPFNLQGSTTYGGSLQPQGTTSQFASGSLSSYPSVSLSSPQGTSSQSATVQSSRKQFTSSFGTQSGSSKPFTLQGSTTYGGSLQPQDTTSQFASGSLSSHPSVSFSLQHPASESATVQSSRKQFTSSFGTQSGFSKPFPLQGSTTYGGSLQPQDTTSQFASGSSSSYPSVLLSSPQGVSSQSATVQSSRKQFTSSFGTQSGFSKPFPLQGSTTYGGSLQPQDTTSQFASGSSSSYPSVLLSSPQGVSSQSATVQSSRKQFTSSYGTQSESSKPFTLQGSTTYGGSLQPQGTTSQFASGSSSSYPSVSLFSLQHPASESATVQSSRKQFTSSFGTQSGFSKPFPLQGSTTYGGSLQPQGTTSQFAYGSLSSYPGVLLSSPQGASSQSATVQSLKQFTSTVTGNSGTQEGSSAPFNLQGSTTYGGSLQPQGTTSQFASGSLSSYPSVSLSSPQGTSSQSATVQSSRKQFTSSFGTQSGSSKPFTLQGRTTYGGSLQPQGTTSQFASGSLSSYPSVSLFSPQHPASHSATVQSSRKQFTSTVIGNSDQSSKAFQSYSVSQSQKSQRWQPSRGIQTSGAAASQGSSLSQSSPMQSSFPSLSSAGGSSSGDPGPFVSAQGGGRRYGGFSLHSQSPSSKYTPGSHAYAKLGSSPLAVSSQSTSEKWSNGLYSSDSLRTQGLIGVVERPSRPSSQALDYTSNQISEHFGTVQRPTGSNLTPSLGLSAQASSVGMFSGIPQTAQTLRESGSGVQLYNQPFLNPRYSVKG